MTKQTITVVIGSLRVNDLYIPPKNGGNPRPKTAPISPSICKYTQDCVLLYEPELNKTYNKTSVTSKDSDKTKHHHSPARVLVYPALDSLAAVDGTCNQQRL